MYRERACLFCGEEGEPLTDEHLWSAWMTPSILKNWPARPEPAKNEPPFTVLARTQGSDGFKHVMRPSRSLNEKPRCLCRDCNNRRLGRIEDLFFKPLVEPMMLDGTPRSLTVEDRLVIAVWAFKTLVVYNHAYNRPPFLYNNRARKRFIDSLLPPEKNLRVWVSRFNVRGRAGHATGLPLGPNRGAEPQFKGLPCYALTFSIGQFMFQVHAITPVPPKRPFDHTHLFPEYGRWRRKASLIWPVSDHANVPWPPPEDLLDTELDEFCCRWGGRFGPNMTDISPLPTP